MAKAKKFGCFAALALASAITAVGWFFWGVIGAIICAVVGAIIADFCRSRPDKERICDICGSPVTHMSYAGEINGKRFDIICAKCKNHVTNKKRKDAMKDLLN